MSEIEKMAKKLMALKIMILASSFFLVSCGQATILEETESIRIVATFYPMVEFTKAVVGEIGEVELLIPAGTEPHDYEPSAKDVAKIHDADAVVYNSQVFETWMNDIKSNLDVTQTNVIEASEGIELLAIEETDHPEASDEDGHLHSQDPHVWLDLYLAQDIFHCNYILGLFCRISFFLDTQNQSFYSSCTSVK